MTELTFEEIRFASISDAGFKILYDNYAPYVWRVAFRTLNGDHNLSQQVVQHVFISVHRYLHQFKANSSFSTWLYKIIWRESIKFSKKKRLIQSREIPLKTYHVVDEIDDKTDLVEEILSFLNAEERFLLVSREIDGFSFEDLEKVTGKKQGSLRTAVSRIKQKIRELYNETE